MPLLAPAAKRARTMAAQPQMMMPGMAMMPGMMPGMMPNMMMPNMMPNMMMPNMMNQVEEELEEETEVPSSAAASSEPNPPQFTSPADMPAYVKSESAFITRSASMLRLLPRCRVSESIEKMNPDLDASYTAPLSMFGLLALLYVFTKLSPLTRIADLRTLPIYI